MFILGNFTLVFLKCFRGDGKEGLGEFGLILGTMSKDKIKNN